MTTIAGIDPGLCGAIAFYNTHDRSMLVFDLPVMGDAKQRCIAGALLANHLEIYRPAHAFIEKVNAMRGWGAGSIFRFGEAFGTIKGVLAGIGIPLDSITSQKWKPHFGLRGSDKEPSRKRAIELLPHAADQFARKCDHNRAEAALLALYGAHTQQQGNSK